jgi:hypothetical protein
MIDTPFLLVKIPPHPVSLFFSFTQDSNMIIGSIKTKLLTLDGDIRVISGHGPETSIAFEKKHNVFLR